ncbi:MAG: hypothetical protein J0M18_16395 [Ignavibacteria bacterium]|nr:hypothetical protein [Ignavibacteria bacterium]
MVKIGLIGENPNDTESVKNLLSRYYNGTVTYNSILKNLPGSLLDNKKFLLDRIYEEGYKDYCIIIAIRDLIDETESNTPIRELRRRRLRWFNELNRNIENKAIFLLNINELEVLFIADIRNSNHFYKTNIVVEENPTEILDPKGYLIQKTYLEKEDNNSECTSIYSVSDAKKLCEGVDINVLKQNLDYFNEFIEIFEQRLEECKKNLKETSHNKKGKSSSKSLLNSSKKSRKKSS